MKATRLAPTNERERKNRKSTIGSTTRRSTIAKAVRPMAETTSSPTIPAEPQPHELPSTSARTRAERPTVMGLTPGKSTWWVELSSRDSRVAARVTATATTATGTLRKKIDCQETFSTRKPPTTGPMASARAETPAHVPMALPRSCGGKAVEMIDRGAGSISAAPPPCTARPLPRPRATDPEPRVGGGGAEGGPGRGEDRDAGEEHAPPAEDVAEPPAGDQED